MATQLTSIGHGSCQNHITGFYEYCMIHDMGGPQQTIYPIGYCRENKQKGKTPCPHKTEDEAKECYCKYELAHFVNGDMGDKDLLLPEVTAEVLEVLAKAAREAADKKAELLAKAQVK